MQDDTLIRDIENILLSPAFCLKALVEYFHVSNLHKGDDFELSHRGHRERKKQKFIYIFSQYPLWSLWLTLFRDLWVPEFKVISMNLCICSFRVMLVIEFQIKMMSLKNESCKHRIQKGRESCIGFIQI